MTDNQGEEFEPIELPDDNAFAYNAQDLTPGQCIPEDGSVAQQGPTAGSMLLFDFPLENTENRPLELEITSPGSPRPSGRDQALPPRPLGSTPRASVAFEAGDEDALSGWGGGGAAGAVADQ